MQVKSLAIPDVKLISPAIWSDERGEFLESYRYSRYSSCGIDTPFTQDNLSLSERGTIRGLHFQLGKGQAKLVSVVVGSIYDVAVDMRPDSPTFKQWVAVTLDDRKREQVLIPEGFAHGFCVLSPTAIVTYKVSRDYDAALESGFRFDDSTIGVEWLEGDFPVTLSRRDREAPSFEEAMELQMGWTER